MVESIAATAGGRGSAHVENEPARERGVSDSRVSASGSGSGSGPAWAAAPARVPAVALAPAPALALAPAPDPALAPVAAARRTSSCARPATGWCLAGPWRRRRAASRPCPALCLGLTLCDTDHRRGRADRRLLARTTAAAATAAEHADPRWLDPPAWPSGDHAARPATQRTGRGAGGRSGPFAPGVSGVTRPCLTALFTPASWPSPQPSPVGLPQLPHGVGWRVHFSSIFIYVHTAISLTCVVKPKPPKVSADSVALALRAYLGAAQARVRAGQGSAHELLWQPGTEPIALSAPASPAPRPVRWVAGRAA